MLGDRWSLLIIRDLMVRGLRTFRELQEAGEGISKGTLAGGVVGLAVSIVGTVVTWNKGPEFGPHWYPLALVALAMPTAWAGGRLRELQASRLGS